MTRSDLSKVWVVSILFAYVVGSGTYGFGHDYYAGYSIPNLARGGVNDQLGFALATLSIYDIHIGVYLTSLLLGVSSGVIVFKLASLFKIGSGMLLFLSFVLLLHTWPIIMSTSNAMRQGIMMSFLYFSFASYLSHAKYRFILFASLAFLTHKSSVLFLALLVIVMLVESDMIKRIVILEKRKLVTLSAAIAFVSVFVLLPNFVPIEEESRIIAGDFRAIFLTINLGYVAFFFLMRPGSSLDAITVYLFIFSFVAPIFLLNGYNWQYERINMIMLIPYMLVFSRIFPPMYRGVYFFIVVTLLLFLTFYSGMYASFY